MKRFLVGLITIFVFIARPALAIYEPLSVANNKVGVHILSPDELESAAKLVNNDRFGSWGYVTVPIQASDRNREKWTHFMKKAADLQVIPIIRVATVVDGSQWLKPGNTDLIDFSNFLNDLPWPTQNHYVIIFNEVNRADEFGGQVSPENYSDILAYALDVFKQRSEKFFVLPAAMDNAAPDVGNFMSWKTYLRRMYLHNPEIFKRLDGWTSHSYGNPDFSADPLKSGENKADSFLYDLRFINQFTPKKLPVFITETGWSSVRLNEQTISNFYSYAFKNLWSHDQVVAVTPFLLFAGEGPFSQFSLLKRDSQPTLAYQTIKSFSTLAQPILELVSTPSPVPIPTQISPTATSQAVLASQTTMDNLSFIERIISFIKNFFRHDNFTTQITIGEKKYRVEIVTSDTDKALGLAKYNSLADGRGMLFKFNQAGTPTFWMKDMKFDIDIVWITENKVVGVSQGDHTNPFALINPPGIIDTVLEVNPNSGIEIGDNITVTTL